MEPYNSFGNGSAMQAPVFSDEATTDEYVRGETSGATSSEVTHNHPEGWAQWQRLMQSLCAVTSSVVITLRRLKTHQGTYRERVWYDQTLDEIVLRTVSMKRVRIPFLRAIVAFLESTDFEDKSEMRFLLVETANFLLQSQEVSPRQLMEFWVDSRYGL